MREKTATSFRLTDDCKALIALLSKKMGVDKTDTIELAIRQLAKAEGVVLPEKK